MLLCLCLFVSVATAAQPLPQAPPQAPPANSTEQAQAAGQLTPEESASESSDALEGQFLSDEELAQLTERSEEPGDAVVGGALSNEHLTYVIIALAAAVVVLIAK